MTVPFRRSIPLPERSLIARIWALTLGLVAAALLSVAAIVRTGGPLPVAVVALAALGGLAIASYRSGGRFEFDSADARPLEPGELPTVRRALLSASEAAGRPPPRLVAMEMDVPGAMIGYEAGRPVLAVDPLLPRVLGPAGLEAVFAHELGHLGTDLHTDALRQYVPQVLGFGAFWLVALAGRGPAVATAGSVGFGVLSLTDRPLARRLRYALGLGVEPLALAVSRHTNRLEELRADEFAAGVVSPTTLAEALYRVAAVATGDNLEDVAGPVPWEADRGPLFRLFATHPSIEHRVTRLGCELPDWVRPYQPHRERPGTAGGGG